MPSHILPSISLCILMFILFFNFSATMTCLEGTKRLNLSFIGRKLHQPDLIIISPSPPGLPLIFIFALENNFMTSAFVKRCCVIFGVVNLDVSVAKESGRIIWSDKCSSITPFVSRKLLNPSHASSATFSALLPIAPRPK